MQVNRLKHYLSAKTESLHKILTAELEHLGYCIHQADEYLYAEPNGKSIPVLLVAHIDTFYNKPPIAVLHDKDYNIMWSPSGLGADDRAGIFAVMEIIKDCRCAVLFTDGEESGGVGASDFIADWSFNPGYKMAIQLDRRGIKDSVFYDNDSLDFQEYINKHNFTTAIGSFSDISTIAPEWQINAVNLSVGFFNEHTKHEYLSLNVLEETIRNVKIMLSATIPKFEYKEVLYAKTNWYKTNTCYATSPTTYTTYTPKTAEVCEYCGKPTVYPKILDGWCLCYNCYFVLKFHCPGCNEDQMRFNDTDTLCIYCQEGRQEEIVY